MSKQNLNISFVIPGYNCQDTISEAVASIFNSNFEKCDEVIIVDDASSDHTLEVIDKLKTHYPIKIIANRINKGCPASRNIGIGKACNELIFNLDSDNVLAPNSIRPLREYLLKNKADAAAFGEIFFFTKNVRDVTHKWIFRKRHFELPDLMASHINPGSAGNFLLTKRIWKKVGKYWEYGKGLHEAWGFHLKLLARGAKYMILPNFYYYHRYGHESLYVRESRKMNEGLKLVNKMIKPFVKLIDPRDVIYLRNNNWFESLNDHPIRVRNSRIGYKGEKVVSKNVLKEKIFKYFGKMLK